MQLIEPEMSTSDLVDLIVHRYHEPLREALPLLVRVAERVEENHEDAPRGLAAHLARMHRELVDHMAREEGVLFPLLCGRDPSESPVGAMLHDHTDLVGDLARMRELTDGFAAPDTACATWRSLYDELQKLERDLVEHVRIEEEILFKRGARASRARS